MNEAQGQTMGLALVMFFIVVISSYLAFTLTYSKAFKVKSKVIDMIEANDNVIDTALLVQTGVYLKQIGYSASDTYTRNCDASEGWKLVTNQGWCYKEMGSDNPNQQTSRKYYKIRTYVVIDIPVINRIFSEIRVFTVEGSTKPTEKLVK